MDRRDPETHVQKGTKCKVYKKRWFILALFCLYAISNRIQFIIYAVISNIIVKYYGVSFAAAQWTSLIGIVAYLVFNIPGSFVLDKLGLRWTVIIGTVGSATGLWIKVAAVHPDRFWLLLLGQGITSALQVLVSPLPVRIAAVWFPKSEVSVASSIGIVGIMISSVFGSLLSSLLVPQNGNQKETEQGLFTLALSLAIFSTALLPILLIFFREAPPTPPSIAQSNIRNDANKKSFKDSLKALFSNRSFVAFLFIFGISYGSAFPIVIVANELITKFHPNAGREVGFITASCLVSGIVGTLVFGFVLDRFKRFNWPYLICLCWTLTWVRCGWSIKKNPLLLFILFRETTLVGFITYVIGLVLFMSTLHLNLNLLYFTITFVGFFGVGLITMAFGLGVELTYPEPEGTVGGLLMTNSQLFGIFFSMGYSFLFNNTSKLVANIIIGSVMFCTMLLFLLVKFDLRRQKVEKKQKVYSIKVKE